MARSTAVSSATLEAAQMGDQLALEAVVEGMEYITRNVVWRWGHPMPADFDDRCQTARIAIWLKAVPKWDARRTGRKSGFESSFGTHAWWWVRAAVKDVVRADVRRRKHEVPVSDMGSDGTDDETKDLIDAIKYLRAKHKSMKDSALAQSEMREELFSCLQKLSDLEQRVIYFRFWEEKTLREIESMSKEGTWGLTPMCKTQLCVVQSRAIERLRGMLVAREVTAWE